MLIWDSIIDADPLVAMVVGPHTVIEHIPSFLDKLGQKPAGSLVLGIDAHMTHQQDDLLAHDGALDGRAAVVQQVSLVLLYRHLATVLQDFGWGCVLEAEGALHHLVGVGQLGWSEAVFIAEWGVKYN